jgi:hypothetical protein
MFLAASVISLAEKYQIGPPNPLKVLTTKEANVSISTLKIALSGLCDLVFLLDELLTMLHEMIYDKTPDLYGFLCEF